MATAKEKSSALADVLEARDAARARAAAAEAAIENARQEADAEAVGLRR